MRSPAAGQRSGRPRTGGSRVRASPRAALSWTGSGRGCRPGRRRAGRRPAGRRRSGRRSAGRRRAGRRRSGRPRAGRRRAGRRRAGRAPTRSAPRRSAPARRPPARASSLAAAAAGRSTRARCAGTSSAGQLLGAAGGQPLGLVQRAAAARRAAGGRPAGSQRLGQVPEQLVQLPHDRERGEHLRGRAPVPCRQSRPPNVLLGDLLAGAEAVVDGAAREAALAQLGVDAAAEVRRAGSGRAARPACRSRSPPTRRTPARRSTARSSARSRPAARAAGQCRRLRRAAVRPPSAPTLPSAPTSRPLGGPVCRASHLWNSR